MAYAQVCLRGQKRKARFWSMRANTNTRVLRRREAARLSLCSLRNVCRNRRLDFESWMHAHCRRVRSLALPRLRKVQPRPSEGATRQNGLEIRLQTTYRQVQI